MNEIKYSTLSDTDKKLLAKAEKAVKNSYNPYTRSKYGAAVLCENGKMFSGTSYACASSGSNLCAERTAIVNANTNGCRKIKKIAIVENDNTLGGEPAMPCGICLQFMQEIVKITGKDLEIITTNDNKTKILKTKLSELFPHPYHGTNGKKLK